MLGPHSMFVSLFEVDGCVDLGVRGVLFGSEGDFSLTSDMSLSLKLAWEIISSEDISCSKCCFCIK